MCILLLEILLSQCSTVSNDTRIFTIKNIKTPAIYSVEWKSGYTKL